MGFTTNLSKRTSISNNLSNNGNSVSNGVGGEGNRGMSFFLVFFPQEQHQKTQHEFNTTIFKRTNSSHILSKAQSTLSICALLIFVTLLLFTLSTFEPNKSSSNNRYHHYRRYLSDSHVNFYSKKVAKKHVPALQKLGTLYSRGTKAMNDLVLCHVSEHVTADELKVFLRAFHRSGLLSKSDLLFIFDSFRTPDYFDNVIRAENKLFFKLVELTNAGNNVSDFSTSFDVTQFVQSGKKELEKGETIWGRKNRSGLNSSLSTELTRMSFGSVVGFGVGELDPENSLSGFLDHVPMSLRRWASYPMLLGRVRHNFKHIMLVDVKEVLLLGDPLPRVRTSSPETVILSYSQPPTTKQNHKISEKTQKKTVNPQIITGGGRGVRKLSAAMLTEIVRVTTSDKKKSRSSSLITETVLLNRLMTNKYLLKKILLIDSGESIQPSSLSGVELANSTMVWRGNSNLDTEFMKHICSFKLEASIYIDCGKVKVQPL
ncbi:hypothetical protein CTI12_AA478980 [Artemisia annua]|uniref:DUF7780 domain-containing protein n=1 Tax=Artemisia annua TaxID=35608 RepID=A0A2U1LL51_ARTAN|nr:hypothetical protein CTI12_AA478980 [Artemisia annua]